MSLRKWSPLAHRVGSLNHNAPAVKGAAMPVLAPAALAATPAIALACLGDYFPDDGLREMLAANARLLEQAEHRIAKGAIAPQHLGKRGQQQLPATDVGEECRGQFRIGNLRQRVDVFLGDQER